MIPALKQQHSAPVRDSAIADISYTLPAEGLDMKGVLQEVWTNEHVVQLEEAIFARIKTDHIGQLPSAVRAVALRRYINNEGNLNRSAIIVFAVGEFTRRFHDVGESDLKRFAESYLDPDDKPERKLTRLPQEAIDQIESLARSLEATFGEGYPLHKAGRINRRFVIHLALEVAATPG